MHPTIPIDSVYVVSSNVIGNQILRSLKDLGFNPARIHPKARLKIPTKAELVVVVPKAISHAASESVQRWADAKAGKFIIYSNSGIALADTLKSMGLLAEGPDDDLLKFHPNRFTTATKYITALIEADPTITRDRFRAIEGFYSLGERRGFSGTRYAKTVWQWRKNNGFPGLGQSHGRSPRPANWMPDVPVEPAVKVSPPLPPIVVDTPEPIRESPLYKEHPASAVAELVWEWMDKNGYESVTFFADGEVGARKKKVIKREFVFHEMEE